MITSDLNRLRAAIAGPTYRGIQVADGFGAILANRPDGRGGRQTFCVVAHDEPVRIRELVEVAS